MVQKWPYWLKLPKIQIKLHSFHHTVSKSNQRFSMLIALLYQRANFPQLIPQWRQWDILVAKNGVDNDQSQPFLAENGLKNGYFSTFFDCIASCSFATNNRGQPRQARQAFLMLHGTTRSQEKEARCSMHQVPQEEEDKTT